jgi:hypothetical protein
VSRWPSFPLLGRRVGWARATARLRGPDKMAGLYALDR